MTSPDRLDPRLRRARAGLDRLVRAADEELAWQRLQAKCREPEARRLALRLARFEAGRSRPRMSDRKDLCLLLFLARGRHGQEAEPLSGTTRVVKLLFLAQQALGLDALVRNPYRFQPYRMGPFSAEVYDDLAVLVDAGLVKVCELEEDGTPVVRYDRENGAGFRLNGQLTAWELTDRGRRFGRALLESGRKRTPDLARRLEMLKAGPGALSLRQLLRAVYEQYPEFTSESEIKDRLGD